MNYDLRLMALALYSDKPEYCTVVGIPVYRNPNNKYGTKREKKALCISKDLLPGKVGRCRHKQMEEDGLERCGWITSTSGHGCLLTT